MVKRQTPHEMPCEFLASLVPSGSVLCRLSIDQKLMVSMGLNGHQIMHSPCCTVIRHDSTISVACFIHKSTSYRLFPTVSYKCIYIVFFCWRQSLHRSLICTLDQKNAFAIKKYITINRKLILLLIPKFVL